MKRLFIDLEKCQECNDCKVNCRYFYHLKNNGVISLIEIATFFLICRKCEEAPCINACYRNALKRDEKGIIHRAHFLCTGCKSCAIACPFGTILPLFLDFLSSQCDFCLKREEIACIESCPYGAIKIIDIDEDDLENDVYIVSDNLAVKAGKWFKEDKELLLLNKKRK